MKFYGQILLLLILCVGQVSYGEQFDKIETVSKKLNAKALSNLEGKNTEQALANLKKALEVNPFDTIVLYNLALLSYQGKQYNNAKDFLARIEYLRPNDKFYFRLLAKVEIELGNWQNGHKYFESLDNDSQEKLELEDLRLWALALHQLDYSEKFNGVYVRMFKLKGHTSDDHLTYARWNFERESSEKTLVSAWNHYYASYKLWAGQKSKKSLAVNKLEQSYDDVEKLIQGGIADKSAVDLLTKQLSRLSKAGKISEEPLARVLFANGQKDQAQKLFERLHQKNQLTLKGAKRLAHIYDWQKRRDLLGALWQDFLRHKPSDEIRCQLIDLHADLNDHQNIYRLSHKIEDHSVLADDCKTKLSDSFFALKKYNKVLELLVQAKALLPSQLYNRARANFYLGKLEEARADFSYLLGIESYKNKAIAYLQIVNQKDGARLPANFPLEATYGR